MPPTTGTPGNSEHLKEIAALVSSTYDKASTYSKLIIGLGYGGFFTAWSGTRQYLSPTALVGSALLVTVSLVLFVVFEIWQAMIVSHLSLDFEDSVKQAAGNIGTALQTHNAKASRLFKPLRSAWYFVFPASAVTGLLGAFILIYAFVLRLVRS